jgi:predicted unusual protein kinase regulating ubiquinone biosynthesis (AarF/ABC1/UbiB family)
LWTDSFTLISSGNVFLTDDHRIALLDLGMVGHITPQLQENLLQFAGGERWPRR